jgi:hypothetical protein
MKAEMADAKCIEGYTAVAMLLQVGGGSPKHQLCFHKRNLTDQVKSALGMNQAQNGNITGTKYKMFVNLLQSGIGSCGNWGSSRFAI